MLQVNGLSKSFGTATVFSNVTFSVEAGDRIGVLGDNGAGKSTLLRCVVGLDRPDAGTVAAAPGVRVGYLAQVFNTGEGESVGLVLRRAEGGFGEAARALDLQSARMVAGEPGAVDAYGEALERFEALGGWARQARAEAVLERMGLGAIEATRPVASLSGGQMTRLGLAALLLEEPDILLLDEPTNHLDIDGVAWLESFVREYPGAVLVVSHDRAFLDATVRHVLFLDIETRTARMYTGNYTDFSAARVHERELHEQAWKTQQEYVGRVKADIARLKGDALKIELSTTPRQPGVRRMARKRAEVALAREKKLDRYLASDERVEKPRGRWTMHVDFGEPAPVGKLALLVEDLRFAYPGGPAVLDGVSFEVNHGERVAIRGANGAGKSTLMALLAGALEPAAGRIRWSGSARPGLMTQSAGAVQAEATVLETLRRAKAMTETDARTFLHLFLFKGDAVHRSVGDCSAGERARLELACLAARGCNVLLLDEPLNHLDISSRGQFEEALDAFGGTVLAVSHDRAFLASFERVLEVRDATVRG